jgi:hypothetical protein
MKRRIGLTGFPNQSGEPEDSHPQDNDRNNAGSGAAENGSDTKNGEAPFEGPKGDPAEGKR